MKTMRMGLLVTGMAAFLLAGCSEGLNGQGGSVGGLGTKQTIGGLGGAVLGGLAGSKIGGGNGRLVAVGAGALLGTLVGSEIGKSLDKADMAYAQRAVSQSYSAPIGQTINWNNPQSGNSGSYTPTRDGYRNDGQYCREYKQTITVDGRSETAVGTACKNSDGTWKIVN